MPYLSEVLRARIFCDGQRIGRVTDVRATIGPDARVTSICSQDRRWHWDSISYVGSRVTVSTPDGEPSFDVVGEFGLSHALLDRQILDARGMKVVRVNDVQLEIDSRGMRIAGVDVGARGFLRRLGIPLESAAVKLADRLGYTITDEVIPWAYVASLEEGSGIKLGVERDLLAKLRPVEVAEILDALDESDRRRLVATMDDAVLADALFEASAPVRAETLTSMGRPRSAHVLALMAPDEATDVLGALDPSDAIRILEAMPEAEAGVVSELLGYHPRTAGGLMTPEFVAIDKNATITEAQQILREEAPDAESVYYIYAVDEEGALRGVIGLRDLLTAPASDMVETIVRTDVLRAHTHDTDENVAELMERYDLLAVPVVDDADVLQGIITVDDVMRTMQRRASEDIAAVTGSGGHSTRLPGGRIGTLAASLTTGLAAAALFLRSGPQAGAWLVVGVIPLLLRMAQDSSVWAMATRLEPSQSPGVGKWLSELAGSGLAVALPAVALGVGAGTSMGPRLGLALGLAIVISSMMATLVGMGLPEILIAMDRQDLLGRGRIVPLLSSIFALAVYFVLLGV